MGKKIVVVGSGNVATHMAIALNAAGHDILQIWSRTLHNAEILSNRVDAEAIDHLHELDCTADLYLFSVKDAALSDIVMQMPSTGGVWVHTAGSLSLSSLDPHIHKGVIYPLQTFSKSREVLFSAVPLFVEGDSPETTKLLSDMAKSISDSVYFLPGEKRKILHLAAVFACNFTNHMYTLASDILEEEQLPFDYLIPLITETVNKVKNLSPKDAQTGPAVRFDENVMEKHQALLHDSLKRDIYTLLSRSIHNSACNL